MLTPRDLDAAQMPTAPTVEAALRVLLPATDLSDAVLEPLGVVPGAPVWVELGDNTYLVQGNVRDQWFATPTTFDGCYEPDETGGR